MSAEETKEVVLSLVLMVSIFLLFMVAAYEIKKAFHLPVMPLLIITGIILRFIGPHIGQLDGVVNLITNLEAEAISYVFLPILILSAGMSTNWHTLRKELWQILPLSTTVVFGCTILIALAIKYIFAYDFWTNDLLLLGVILSATDHIAVTALLKDIYASDELETLISGETMFSQATVIVIFQVLLNHNIAESAGAQEAFLLFLRLLLGGFAMGIGFSLALSYLLKRILNNFFLETNFVLVAAYLLFWVCEIKDVEFSGALALVTFGVYMSAYGKTLISPTVEERMYEIIGILERNAESIVFIISGVLFADVIYSNSELKKKDYWILAVLFPLTYLIRFVILLCHYPILQRLGYGLTWREFIVLGFCGMKGVISVGLVLIASHDTSLDSHFRAILSYFGIGVAGLSIIFGGLASRISVRLLGLEDLTDVQQTMLASVVSSLNHITEKKIEKLQNNKDFKLANWNSVLELSGPTSLVTSILKKTKIGKTVIVQNKSSDSQALLRSFTSHFRLEKKALEVEMRRRYLATLKKLYWEKFTTGLCHGTASIILIDCCSTCLDKDSYPMKDWEIVRNFLTHNSIIALFTKLSKIPLIGKLFRKTIYKRIILAYDVANNFISSHKETEKLIDEMEIDIDKQIFEEIMNEAHLQVKHCEEYLKKYIIDCYPEVLAEVQTKRCCKILLYNQRELIEDIYEKQVITEIEYESLMESIDASIQIVTFQGIPSIPVLREILSNRFSGASAEDISKLINSTKEYIFSPGHVLFSEDSPGNGAYFIIRGRIREHSTWIDQELIIGNIVGVQYLLPEFSSEYKSTATTITSTVVAHIPKEILEVKGFVQEFFTEACEEMILMNKSRFGLEGASEVHVLRIIEASVVKSFVKGKSVAFENGGLVLKGKIYEGLSGYFIKPSIKSREIAEDSIVLVLPDDFKYAFNKGEPLSVAFKKYCVKLTDSFKKIDVEDIDGDESQIIPSDDHSKVFERKITFKR